MQQFQIQRLTKEFYKTYPNKQYSEILLKKTRPYAVLAVNIDGVDFALPFRSDITHSYAFITDASNPKEKCGVDYSKAIVIIKSSYVEHKSAPRLRQNEFNALKGNEYKVIRGFKKYLNNYKKAAKRQDVQRNIDFCKYSTLQYFHNELGIKII